MKRLLLFALLAVASYGQTGTPKTQSELYTQFADGQAGTITAAYIRHFVASIVPATKTENRLLRFGAANAVSQTSSLTEDSSGNVVIGSLTISSAGVLSGITLPVSIGGTGATTAAGAQASLLPSYTGNGGKVLAVNTGATAVEWVVQTGGTGTPPYAIEFTSDTTITVTAATHGLGTDPLDGGCYATSGAKEEFNTWAKNGSGDVTITFEPAWSGFCFIHGGTSGGEGGGDTTSVANSGAGEAVLKTGTNVTAKTLVAGTNITLTSAADTITIASTASGGAGDVTNFGDTQTISSWGTIAANARVCKTVNLTGVVDGDIIMVGLPATLEAYAIPRTKAGSDVFEFCLYNTSASTQAIADGQSFKFMVLRSTI